MSSAQWGDERAEQAGDAANADAEAGAEAGAGPPTPMYRGRVVRP